MLVGDGSQPARACVTLSPVSSAPTRGPPTRILDPDGDHDARTEAVIHNINLSGEAWFGPTTYNGLRVMRISVSNYLTTADDVDRVVAAFEQALT